MRTLAIRTYIAVVAAISTMIAFVTPRPQPAFAGATRRRGATMIEYAILAVFAVIIGALIFLLRGPIGNMVNRVKSSLNQ